MIFVLNPNYHPLIVKQSLYQILKITGLVILAYLSGFQASSQVPDKTRILFLLDASGSMQGKLDNEIKMVVAKRLLSKMVDSLRNKPNLEIALRVYGHTTHKDKKNCKDTKLEIPFSKTNHDNIKEKIKTLQPLGTTMIAYSLQEAAYDFPKDNTYRNIIILITDGIEECGGDPCAVSEALQRRKVILKPFIIGLGLSEDYSKKFECVGRFFNANSEQGFDDVLQVIISQAMNNTTLQVNLLNENGLAQETDVNMTFYDNHSHKMEDNYVETITPWGVPDTISLDPVTRYDITVHTLPPVKSENVEIVAGRHNIVAMSTPQGSLKLKVDGTTNYKRLQCVVKKAGTNEVVNVQDFNTQEKYLTGAYDLDILSTPKICKANVIISQSSVNEIIIPQPGKLNFYSARGVVGAIFRMNENKLEWVINMGSNPGVQAIMLQPGSYKLICRSNTDKGVIGTKRLDFEIKSGQIYPLNL